MLKFFLFSRMFTARKKIVKEKDAPIDAFEEQVAQVVKSLLLQISRAEIDLYFYHRQFLTCRCSRI